MLMFSNPLCEEVVYEQVDAYYERETAKRELAEVAHIDDDKLLGRLVDAGFTPKTFPALKLAPIAFVAWASESVTDKESHAVVMAIYEGHLHEHPSAAARMQSWLDVRPTQELWDLWGDFTKHRLNQSPQSFRQTMGLQLLRRATKVAIASGGFLGFGGICKAENAVLQAIRDIYFVCD